LYDSAAIRATVGHMRENALVLPGLNYKPSELATFLGRFHIVLSMRVHPLILGALGSALPVGIIRQPKMTRVLDEMGFELNVQAESAVGDEMYELCRHRFSDLASLRLKMKGRLAFLAERELGNRRAMQCLGGSEQSEMGTT
jgi:polysaccharide pyruvyl transferase WcaK-like protein